MQTQRAAQVRGYRVVMPTTHIKITLFVANRLENSLLYYIIFVQVVVSRKQSHTTAPGCVWFQRAHPVTNRVKTKQNVKVSANEDSGAGTVNS